MHEDRKQSKTRTRQYRLARTLKYAGLVELTVNREVDESEYRCFVAELQGGARYV